MSTPFSLMWYNTENFYDTVDDPNTMDDDFTPNGSMHWTQDKFDDKLGKITSIIRHIVEPLVPDIIGLAEIENKTVMMAIVDKLSEEGMSHYSFIHYDSPDERGIDIGVIYNTRTLRILESRPIRVQLPGIEDRTRDIVYIQAKTTNDEILYFFFAHFPSRREGTERSERRRFFVASELHNVIYNILNINPQANIIVSGDFNDTPDDLSIYQVLGAQKEFTDLDNLKLYNLLYPRHKRGIGSTYYKGWLLFDQIIVSGGLLKSEKIACKPEMADVFNPPYLIHFNKQGIPSPERTYGKKYVGGYSDHLPIYLKMMLE